MQDSSNPIPERLGPYVLGAPLGRGGMGVVYRATDPRLSREVALKVMTQSTESDDVGRKRFMREMKAQAALSHPNIVKIYDVGVESGYMFFVMELLEGCTLKATIQKEGAQPPLRVARIGLALARALGQMHDQGILHRDIKPQNVFLRNDGEPLLMDLGLVRIATSTVLTEIGTVVGTPRYLAPEVLMGGPADIRSDVYQLGLTLFEAAAGHVPFDATTPQSLVSDVLSGNLPPVQSLNAAVDDRLASILHSMTACKPRARAPDTRVVARALERYAHSTGDVSAPGKNRESRARLSRGDLANREHVPRPPASPLTSLFERAHLTGPAGSRTRAAVSVCMLAGAVVCTLVFRHHATLDTPSPVASASDVAVVPAPAGSVAAAARSSSEPGAIDVVPDRLDSLTGQWRDFLSYLPSLEMGGKVAGHTAASLRKQSRLDFGTFPESWIHWLRLSQWLADPRGPWPPPGLHTSLTPPGAEDAMRVALDEGFRKIDPTLTPQAIVDAFELVAQAPGDGRTWLLLGRVLDVDGASHSSLSAYDAGLKRLGSQPVKVFSRWVWAGLARALALVPGHHLESEWPGATAAQVTGLRLVWEGLEDALSSPGMDQSLYARLLATVQADHPQSDGLLALLGEARADGVLGAVPDPEGALRTWNPSHAALDSREQITQCMLKFYLERGDLAAARRTGEAKKEPMAWANLEALLAAPMFTGPIEPIPARLNKDELRLRIAAIAAYRMLEAGHMVVSLPPVDGEAFDLRDRDTVAPLVLELAAAGSTDTNIQRLCDQYLLGREFLLREWSIASGAFLGGEGAARFTRWLAQRRAHWPGEPGLALVEALWNSRRGLYLQSLTLLEAALAAAPGARLPSGPVAEILGRPVWAAALGARDAREAAKRALRFTLPSSDPLVTDYFTHLVSGDLDGAATLAEQLFRRDPQEPIWALVSVWNAVRRGDRGSLDPLILRARISFHFQMAGLWALRSLERK